MANIGKAAKFVFNKQMNKARQFSQLSDREGWAAGNAAKKRLSELSGAHGKEAAWSMLSMDERNSIGNMKNIKLNTKIKKPVKPQYQKPIGPEQAPVSSTSTKSKTAPVTHSFNEDERMGILNKWNDQGQEAGFKGQVSRGFALNKGNMKASLEAEGHGGNLKGFAKATGVNALQGAVGGAVIGGTASAAQGGNFWDGAKEGAFNGAVGWAGAHTYRRSIGAETMFKGPNSVVNTAKNNYKFAQQLKKDGNVSKQAAALLSNRQMAGLSYAVTKGAVK